MAIQGFFTGDVKIRDLNGVLKAVDGIVEVATDAGTVTSVGLTVGSTGTDVNVANSPVTTSGNITLNLPTASATNRGLLSSADWTTFNSKQGAITLTTTGSSGAATLIGTTLNIPNYTGALAGYVPYTGATTNVNLGEYGISSGYFQADLTPSGSLQVGRMQWNSTDGTMDLRLMGNNVTLQIGQEQVARVVNGTGGNLLEANYQAVKIIGAQGQRLQVGLARADNDANSKDTLGLVTENINNNQEGFVTVSGLVNEINTTGSLQGETWADGDTLYLSGTTSGAITNVKPSAPIHTVIVGFVVYAHANHGKIFVKVDNGYELEELHDVAPTPYVNKGVLYRDTATNLWKSATIGTLLGYTPANAATTLTINGTAYDLSANRTWNVGTVTSIGTSGPLTGGTITGSGTIGITQSSAASDGYLSNTDWTTFNNKQTALNGTGFVKISGTTISYDNSTYYLASNPSAFIALTALSATAPLSYDNTTGVFSISQATTSTNGYLSSTDWNTFNNKQAAGSYITALTGEATATGPGSASVTLSTSAVTGKILTGLNLTGGGTIADTDSILQAFGKVQNQISGLAGGVTYQGVWNASTNTPTLTSSVGTKGYYYIVDVAGSTNLNGITDWKVGDWAIFNGSTWDKVDNTDAVSSVNGFTGAVSLTTSNIAEGTNLYYLDSRARLALSFTAGSGAYDNTTGVITIPTNTSQLTNGANFITLSSLSASSPLSYNSGTGALSIQVANGSQNGYLSSTDWTTFNSKQPAGNYVTTDTVQTITALKTFTSKVTLNTGGTDDQLQIVGTAPSVRLTNAVTGATINGFIAMSGANDNYIQGSVSGDMTIGNQNNGKILFGFGSGTATQKLSLDSSGNAVLAGGLTLGSTLSNGTYTYTLPGATGTLALVGGAGVGTVTSVAALTIGTSGTDLSSTVANSTTTPVITLNVPTASATNRGVLSSTDWTTFNNKQNALTNPVTGTGTTNYLPKFTGTSTIGNSQIFDNGTNVGIGTANPLVKLHVDGTGTQYFRLSSSTNSTFQQMGATSGGTFLEYKTLYRLVDTDNGTRLTLDTSGNLGLGVTPSAWGGSYKAVQIANSALWAATNDLHLTLNTLYDGAYKYIDSGYATRYNQYLGQHIWYNAPSGTAGNAISFTQAMTLNASGNLSIGNTNDTYKLDVSGTGRFTGAVTMAANSKVEGSGAPNFVLASTSAVGSGVGPYQTFRTNGSDFGYIGSRDALLSTTGNMLSLLGLNGLSFHTGASYTERFTIASTGAATFSSSVSLTSGFLSVDGFGNKDTNYITMRSGFAPSDAGGIGFKAIDHSGSGTDGLACYGHDGVSFYTAQTERMRITSGGLIFYKGSSTTTNAEAVFENTNSLLSIESAASGSVAKDIRFVTSAGATLLERMRITSGGNVGIGTSSPTSISTFTTLEIRGATGGGIKIGKTGFSQFNIQQDGTDAYFNNVANGAMYFYTNDAERMRITSGGNVGIGVTNPGYKLTVKESGVAGAPLFAFIGNASNGNWMRGYWLKSDETTTIAQLTVQDGDAMYIGTATSIPFIMQTAGSERMRITSGGAVEMTGTIKTGAPTNGTAQTWKLGNAVSGSLSTNHYIIVEINGTTYSIPALQGLP